MLSLNHAQKTAVEFAKQLKDLKKQNDVRKAQVESLSKPQGKAGGVASA